MSLISGIQEKLSGVIDYANPLKSIQALITNLGIVQGYYDVIAFFATTKANNVAWTDGVLNLLFTEQIELRKPPYNWRLNPKYSYEKMADQLEYIEANLVTVNPATGQPYGFGSADLETGEIVQDGVIIKPGMDISQLKKVITNDPNQAKTNIWPWVLVLGGAVLLRKKKRKKQ